MHNETYVIEEIIIIIISEFSSRTSNAETRDITKYWMTNNDVHCPLSLFVEQYLYLNHKNK